MKFTYGSIFGRNGMAQQNKKELQGTGGGFQLMDPSSQVSVADPLDRVGGGSVGSNRPLFLARCNLFTVRVTNG